MRGGRSLSAPEIAGDLIAILEFYCAMGIEHLPLSLELGLSHKATVRSKALFRGRKGETGSGIKKKLLHELSDEIGDCVRCKLSKQRTNLVFGEGNSDAKLMFIGEAPGREEDIQGRPFVGEAGMLLTKLIEKMGFAREDVYIGNIVKCRPPMNRDPEGDEVAPCRQFIERQIDIIEPEVIVTLGRIALQTLMNNPELKITSVRGNFYDFRGIPVMPTFHPAYLLRNPKDKWLTWADAQKVIKRLEKRHERD